MYQFHLEPYTLDQKIKIIQRYLHIAEIRADQKMLEVISEHITNVPRQIANFCTQLKDYMIVYSTVPHTLTTDLWKRFWTWTSLEK